MIFLGFYIFMIILFGTMSAYDFGQGTVTGFSFGWLIATVYFFFRFLEVKQLLKERNDEHED